MMRTTSRPSETLAKYSKGIRAHFVGTNAKPPVKWVGGKRQILGTLLSLLPTTIDFTSESVTYHERFLGGGAMFFGIGPRRSRLSDLNPELINMYTVIRDNLENLLTELNSGKYTNDESAYYKIRSWDRQAEWTNGDTFTPVARAARTIYLNKTGYNGLYRVNGDGQFNAPFGKHEKPTICNKHNLRSVSTAIRRSVILAADYKDIEATFSDGDFAYFDPPYQPVSITSDFTSYTKERFVKMDQVELSHLARRLVRRGVYVMLSNSDSPVTRELYDGFRKDRVNVPRAISCKGNGRGSVPELVIMGYDKSGGVLNKI